MMVPPPRNQSCCPGTAPACAIARAISSSSGWNAVPPAGSCCGPRRRLHSRYPAPHPSPRTTQEMYTARASYTSPPSSIALLNPVSEESSSRSSEDSTNVKQGLCRRWRNQS